MKTLEQNIFTLEQNTVLPSQMPGVSGKTLLIRGKTLRLWNRAKRLCAKIGEETGRPRPSHSWRFCRRGINQCPAFGQRVQKLDSGNSWQRWNGFGMDDWGSAGVPPAGSGVAPEPSLDKLVCWTGFRRDAENGDRDGRAPHSEFRGATCRAEIR